MLLDPGVLSFYSSVLPLRPEQTHSNDLEMSFLDEYKETREKFRVLYSMILNDVDKGYGDKVAESIGILENSRIVFESYPERDAFFDFMVHGEVIDGKSSLSAYLEKSRESKDSNKLFRIMKASEVSLYE